MLSDVMLIVIMLGDVLLNVVAPLIVNTNQEESTQPTLIFSNTYFTPAVCPGPYVAILFMVIIYKFTQ